MTEEKCKSFGVAFSARVYFEKISHVIRAKLFWSVDDYSWQWKAKRDVHWDFFACFFFLLDFTFYFQNSKPEVKKKRF